MTHRPLTVIAISGHRQLAGDKSKDFDSWRTLARSVGKAVCVWAGPPVVVSEDNFAVTRRPRQPGFRSLSWAAWAIHTAVEAVRAETRDGRQVVLNGGEQWGWVVAATSAALTHKPWIMEIHGSYLDLPAASVGKFKSVALRQATLLFAKSATTCRVVNEPMLDALRSRGISVQLIPPRLQESWERPVFPQRKSAREYPRILTVGRLTGSKGYDLLLEAVADLEKQGLKLQLDIVGDGPEMQQLVELAEKLELSDVVSFQGSQDSTYVREAMMQSDLFVISSRDEGLPRTLLEAVATGVPVVATRVGGIPSAAASIPSVNVVDVTASSIAAGIRDVLSHPPSSQMLEADRQNVLKNYGFRNGINTLASMYEQLR